MEDIEHSPPDGSSRRQNIYQGGRMENVESNHAHPTAQLLRLRQSRKHPFQTGWRLEAVETVIAKWEPG